MKETNERKVPHKDNEIIVEVKTTISKIFPNFINFAVFCIQLAEFSFEQENYLNMTRVDDSRVLQHLQ